MRRSQISGIVTGVVSDNKHPDGKYMVKCDFPWIRSSESSDDSEFPSPWLRVGTPMAGNGMGFRCLPEPGDEVAVMFVHGDMNQGIVVCSLWNDVDKTPHGGDAPPDTEDPMGNPGGIADSCVDSTGANEARFMYSKRGSLLLFDDTDGKQKFIAKSSKGSCLFINDEKDCVSVYDAGKEVYLQLDKGKNKITLEATKGDIDIFCKKGTLTIEAKKIVTKAETTQEHESGTSWNQKSGSTMDLEAGGTMTLKGGPKIDLNP